MKKIMLKSNWSVIGLIRLPKARLISKNIFRLEKPEDKTSGLLPDVFFIISLCGILYNANIKRPINLYVIVISYIQFILSFFLDLSQRYISNKCPENVKINRSFFIEGIW